MDSGQTKVTVNPTALAEHCDQLRAELARVQRERDILMALFVEPATTDIYDEGSEYFDEAEIRATGEWIGGDEIQTGFSVQPQLFPSRAAAERAVLRAAEWAVGDEPTLDAFYLEAEAINARALNSGASQGLIGQGG